MARMFMLSLAALAIFGSLGALSGCNTVAGAGQDIERGGQAVTDGAKDVQKKM